MAVSREDRLHAEDLKECGRVGAEFGLGEIEAISRITEYKSHEGVVWCIGIGWSLFALLPLFEFTDGTPPSPWIFTTVLGVLFGAGFAATWWLVTRMIFTATVTGRLCLYSGGVAQLARGKARPMVLRWGDVEAITIFTANDDDGAPTTTLSQYVLRGTGQDGATETEIIDRGKTLRPVTLAAHRVLAPRFVPQLISSYDSGEPVIAGRLRVDQRGITTPADEHFGWHEINGVELEPSTRPEGAPATRIYLSLVPWRPRIIDPSGIPNGIFLAHVITHAAMRNGIEVRGYQEP
jgi:hypothetical protein